MHNKAAQSPFHPFRTPGFAARETTINPSTNGVASVMVPRPSGPAAAPATKHDTDILITDVMSREDSGRL